MDKTGELIADTEQALRTIVDLYRATVHDMGSVGTLTTKCADGSILIRLLTLDSWGPVHAPGVGEVTLNTVTTTSAATYFFCIFPEGERWKVVLGLTLSDIELPAGSIERSKKAYGQHTYATKEDAATAVVKHYLNNVINGGHDND